MIAALALAAGAGAAAPEPAANTAAAVFGARELVSQASLSPDGKTVAFVAAGPGRTTVLLTGTPDTGLKAVLHSSGAPDRLRSCHWSTATRLVCSIYLIIDNGGGPSGLTRLVTLNSDGTGLKLLTAAASTDALGFAADGGGIVDWSGGADGGAVLMTREFVPEFATGTRLANDKRGTGLERVDTTTLARATVEQPDPSVDGYITDGHGAVRIRAMRAMSSAGYVANTMTYQYRPKGGSLWRPLSTASVVTHDGFEPEAVDRDADVAYGFSKVDGREALFRMALDGSGRRELVMARPDVDVDGLVRIGRQHRVVGVTWATERRVAQFFDPELNTLAGKLGKALAGKQIDFIDASADETKLLMWAGSDVDPGKYYLYDKGTHQLVELLTVRPGLANLSPVRAIRFPAADGTPIPAYLTLPPGAADAKGLPALVMPHGGPDARDEWGFDWLSQYWAQRGFAVLQPEFRGSTGWGDAWFAKNGFQSWRLAIGDVTDAGRWLVGQGARADRLAVFGWSYGGYAALQSAVLDPALFKAVVAVAPVTDLVTLKQEAQRYSNAAEVEARIGTGPHVREGSPAQNAKAIRAPVLLFHGDQDQNVAIAQSRLMADRLRGAGAHPQYVEYKGLDHQLEDSAARADMLAKADAFLRASMGM